MKILPYARNGIICDTRVGSIHVTEDDDGEVEIYYSDHFTLKIKGKHKQVPLVTIDSEEFLTRLDVLETGSIWVRDWVDEEEK